MLTNQTNFQSKLNIEVSIILIVVNIATESTETWASWFNEVWWYKQTENILTTQTNFPLKLNFEVSIDPNSQYQQRINLTFLRCLLEVKQTDLEIDKTKPDSNKNRFPYHNTFWR